MANPYAAPVSDQERKKDLLDGDQQVTAGVLDSMKQTRPWVLLMSIVGFLGAAFMILVAVVALMGGSMFGAATEVGAAAVVYFVGAVAYVFASLYLYRYAGAIKLLLSGYGVHALEEALSHQKSFWKLVGILTAVFVVLNVAMLMFIGLAAVIAGGRS